MFRCTTSPYGSNRGRSCSSVASRGTCSRRLHCEDQPSLFEEWGPQPGLCRPVSERTQFKDPWWLQTVHVLHLAGEQPQDAQPNTHNGQMLSDGSLSPCTSMGTLSMGNMSHVG